MGISVIKTDEGYWSSFEATLGKKALVNVKAKLLNPNPISIVDKAILETLEEVYREQN